MQGSFFSDWHANACNRWNSSCKHLQQMKFVNEMVNLHPRLNPRSTSRMHTALVIIWPPTFNGDTSVFSTHSTQEENILLHTQPNWCSMSSNCLLNAWPSQNGEIVRGLRKMREEWEKFIQQALACWMSWVFARLTLRWMAGLWDAIQLPSLVVEVFWRRRVFGLDWNETWLRTRHFDFNNMLSCW